MLSHRLTTALVNLSTGISGNPIGNPSADTQDQLWSIVNQTITSSSINSSETNNITYNSLSPSSSSSIQNLSNNHYSHLASSLNSFDINPKTRNPYGSGPVLPDDNANWDGLFQLIGLSLVSTLGSMGGIFVISAIVVIDTFQVRGNVYLVSLSLSHLLVTILVIPASCVAIMANIPDDPSICHFQWLVTLSTLTISIISFMFMSVENLKGLTAVLSYEKCCTKLRIVLIVIIIWLFGLALPLTQHVNSFGPSVCSGDRISYSTIDPTYHLIVSICLFIFPTLVTLLCFTRCFFITKWLRSQLEINPTEDPWAYMLTDESLLKSNICVYISSFCMWTPLIITSIVNIYSPVAQEWLNSTWYLALSHSCVYSFLYAATNRDFAEAFFKLFYYCCCKSHVNWARKGCGPRRGPSYDPMGLRVHIIPGLNMCSQRREGGSSGGSAVGGGSTSFSTRLTSSGGGGSMGGGSSLGHHSGGGFSFGGHGSGSGGGGGSGFGHSIGGSSCTSGPFARSFQSARAYRTTGDL
ncbi:protein trapped in endoderm-1-like [Panonychus citri]|uniref:protein trapped in endoderm-1-like n=1 Tax=Panonychus citri TaxID=50023 RepID=UPI0023078C16|nr:protein trapped in endoderm-1-like [Panonychus citri]